MKRDDVALSFSLKDLDEKEQEDLVAIHQASRRVETIYQLAEA